MLGTFCRVQRRSSSESISAKVCFTILGYSILMTGLPILVVEYAKGSLSVWTETLVFALIPALVVFFVSQSTADFGLRESPLGLLVPALAGFGGAALLLPFSLPSSATSRMWLILLLVTAALSAWAALQLHKRLGNVPVLPATAIFSASTFVLAAPGCFTQAGRISSWSFPTVEMEVLRTLLLDGPMMLVTVWLLGKLPPVAFSSRYPLTVALTIAEGYVLLRPETTWTTSLGLLLLLASGAWLLVAGSREVS